MRACPSCRALGIPEHSVLVVLDEYAVARDSATTYSQCAECDAIFVREGPEGFVAQPPHALEDRGRTIQLIPPWKRRTDDGSFERSWDAIEAFFEDQAHVLVWVRPLYALLAELRAAGLDARLRAGQSQNTLGLSRAREHGLRPGQDNLFLQPQADGSLVVEGRVAGGSVAFGPVAARYDGRLRAAIESLVTAPVD